ncbi:hypothetical protein AOLI_G00031600 [Acnodon oligacanthus]
MGKAPCVIHRNRAPRLPALRVEIAPRQQSRHSAVCYVSHSSSFSKCGTRSMGVTPIIYVTSPPEAVDGNSQREDYPSSSSSGAAHL